MADLIITDVPYGGLSAWTDDGTPAINRMLINLAAHLNERAVVAVVSDKRQKINNPPYRRIEKFNIGKRKAEILIYTRDGK